MEIRQLKYFLTIVEQQSFSGAAKKLHMTQPPISQQLKLLEDELEVSLIERTTRKLVTTEAGDLLYARAKEVLDLLDVITEEIKELREGVSGNLSIGTISSLGSLLLPRKIQKFNQLHPKVAFQVYEGDPNRIMELLENRIIDLGIVRLPVNTQVFDMIRLPREPMIAVMNQQWGLSNEGQYINLSDLEEKPLMVLNRQQGTSTYIEDMHTLELVKAACREANFEPTIMCKSDDLATLLNWAYHGIGIAVVPKSSMTLLPNKEISYKEITNPGIKSRPCGIIWRKNGYLSTTSRKFLEYFHT